MLTKMQSNIKQFVAGDATIEALKSETHKSDASRSIIDSYHHFVSWKTIRKLVVRYASVCICGPVLEAEFCERADKHVLPLSRTFLH
jgi:hypothetical protein